MNIDTTIADSAAVKMTTGSLMTLGEVAARLAVSPMTVHRMPLTSIRLGRSLRFDPRDVEKLIAESREEVTPTGSAQTSTGRTLVPPEYANGLLAVAR